MKTEGISIQSIRGSVLDSLTILQDRIKHCSDEELSVLIEKDYSVVRNVSIDNEVLRLELALLATRGNWKFFPK